jgi:hypothetical protein
VAARVAEHVMRVRRFGPKLRYRIDLHGVSVFGPGEARTMLRWEWIEDIAGGGDGVVVRSAGEEVRIPAGAFGLGPAALAERLAAARSITNRPQIIGELSGH